MSGDIEGAIRANLDQIDDLFLNTVALNLQAAEQAGRSEEAKKLELIGDVLMKLIQESQPAEIRLINELLASDYPEGTQAVLEKNRQQVDAQLLEIMRLVGDDLSQSGQDDAAQRVAALVADVLSTPSAASSTRATEGNRESGAQALR